MGSFSFIFLFVQCSDIVLIYRIMSYQSVEVKWPTNLIFGLLVWQMSTDALFINMFCPTEWQHGISFYDDYDSLDFPVLNQIWSNASLSLIKAAERILSGSLYNKCFTNATYSPIEWCRESINHVYRQFVSTNISDVLLARVVCYHLCLHIITVGLIGNDSNRQVCPTPCHQKDICTQLDSSAIECIPTRTVIFSHDFKCSCKAKSYWNTHRQRCARMNPCDSDKYYPCYRPGTAMCVYDQKESVSVLCVV